jgi:hypothetical protein
MNQKEVVQQRTTKVTHTDVAGMLQHNPVEETHSMQDVIPLRTSATPPLSSSTDTPPNSQESLSESDFEMLNDDMDWYSTT